jgi:hypothetical protein
MTNLNLSAPWIANVRLWNLFWNHIPQWGFGLLQIGTWHLIYISSDGFLFCEDMERIQS